jgi:DNA-binding MarR family transcriptional regulator
MATDANAAAHDADDPDDGDGIAALSLALRGSIGRVYRRFRTLRAHDELGDAALGVLTHLRKVGPQSLTALSEDARVTPSSMSQTVNRLAAADYVVRGADPDDGRRVLFHLTEAGRRIEAEGVARSRTWFDGALGGLEPRERTVLDEAAAILRRIADAPDVPTTPTAPAPEER